MATRRPGGDQDIPRPDGWRPGDPVPWPSGATVDVATAIVRLHSRLRPDHYLPDDPDARLAAVLVVLADGAHGAEVLLTRRSASMRSHRGEVSFPGGRIDPGESVDAAALREAWEEVALPPSEVTVVAHLDPMQTFVTNSYIVPVVGWVASKPDLRAAAAEVDRILWVPLAELVRPDTYSAEWWELWGEERQMWFFHLDDETVWGATGRMLFQLLSIVLTPS